MAAITATVKGEPVLSLIGIMDEFGDMIDGAARAVHIGDKTEDWYKRMLVMTPWFKSGALKMDWRQVKLAPETAYIPVVIFKESGLEMVFDPVAFPTEDDVIQITIAMKAGQ